VLFLYSLLAYTSIMHTVKFCCYFVLFLLGGHVGDPYDLIVEVRVGLCLV
jgi:hypothetical protein